MDSQATEPVTEQQGGLPEASADLPLDRTHAPVVPAAVADLWHGSGYAGGLDPEQVRVALSGVSSIVNGLTTEHYVVGLKGGGTAWTDLKARRVNITTGALADERLTLIERLGVTTAMAVHERGHAAYSKPTDAAVRRAFGTDPVAHRLSNILDDVRLEARTTERFPAFGGLFPLAMWWVAQRYPSGIISRLPGSQAEALNLAVAAIRYSVHTGWATDPALLAERDWWVEWAARGTATDKTALHVETIREAMDRIAALPLNVSKPAPSEDESEDSDESEDPGQAEGDEPGAGLPDEDEDSEDEDEDAPGGTGADESDEDEDSEDEDEDDAESDEGDEPEDGEDSEDEGDEPMDAPSAGNGGDQDSDEDAEADESDENDSESGDGFDSDEDGESDEDEDSGEDTYLHAESDEDEDGSGSDDEPTDEAGVTVYGKSARDFDPEAAADDPESGLEQRDSLDSALPLHASEADMNDDRNRDVQIGNWIESQSMQEARDRIVVTHDGGHKVTVGILPLFTKRVRIGTSASVQGALRAAFASRRTAHDGRNVARSGRISGSRAYRVRAGFDNVFTRRDALSPDRLDIHLLVDASGSMAGSRLEQAGIIAANLVEALTWLPNVRVHTWAHNTGYGTTVFDVHDSRRAEPVGRIGGIRSDGANNDASAIAAVTSLILKERSPRERSILLVLSDGAPCEDESWVRGAVERARSAGIGVVSVAVAGGLTRTQEACYGPLHVVPWTGDWDLLGRGMAQIIGRLA